MKARALIDFLDIATDADVVVEGPDGLTLKLVGARLTTRIDADEQGNSTDPERGSIILETRY